MQQKKAQLAVMGKKITGNDMKKIKGGWWTGGLWVCTADLYRCFTYLGTCQNRCSDPSACQWYPQCP
jgi:hypothetical protein